MSAFSINVNGEDFVPEVKVFAGGEVNVSLPKDWWIAPHIEETRVLITATLKSSDDIMALLLLTDAIRQCKSYLRLPITLHMKYCPYARQDRVCNRGEALSIKVFANLINGCDFDRVLIWDAHSDVSAALIDNCINVSASGIINNSELGNTLEKTYCVLISPDAGANKKVLGISKDFGGVPVVRADKSRDLKTGEITGTEVYCEDLKGNHCIVIDDICDGGRTFIELAKALKAKGAGMLTLYVTHGIFSYGAVEKLKEAGYDHIYTTDSFYQLNDSRVTVI